MLPAGRFQQYINQYDLFNPAERILLAVSGGMDSVLMAHLFAACNFKFAVAHCNFLLRDEEAAADEELTEKLAQQLQVPFYSNRFETSAYAKKNRISIQMAARELRYQWLEKVRDNINFDYIAVAHHQNDAVETMLLNLIRGTGIAGMHGILPKRGKLIRPLLFLTRDEIAQITTQENISYRTDSSNLSSKYARNKIRLEVIPKLKELNPALEDTFKQNAMRFAELEILLNREVSSIRDKLFSNNFNEEMRLNLKDLQKLEPLHTLVFELFRPFNFTESVINDLIRAWDAQPGKMFSSSTHQIILDRGCLLISRLSEKKNEIVLIHAADKKVNWKSIKYIAKTVSVTDFNLSREKRIAQLDAGKLQFPLQIRNWQEGDIFLPMGMNGSKKVSDFFIAEKIPLINKNNIPLLVNGNGDLLWIAGYRIDERYKVTPGTKKIFILEQHI